MSRSDMSRSDRPTIDAEKQKVAFTMPKLAALMVAVAIGTIAYTQLATVHYVDEKHAAVMQTVNELASSQTNTQDQIGEMAETQKRQDRRLKLLVKLTAAQYLQTADERPARDSTRAKDVRKVAKALNMDPDDPLAGVELLGEALDDEALNP